MKVGQKSINGLQVRYLDDKNCSINKALSNQFLSEEKHRSISRRGDSYYGQDDWKIK